MIVVRPRTLLVLALAMSFALAVTPAAWLSDATLPSLAAVLAGVALVLGGRRGPKNVRPALVPVQTTGSDRQVPPRD
ncbi:MAG: hypothetical protein OEY23_00615 [Acidimicrobiia bacterium]|nr:hypothetical protein [Acidimicrobiia bacterium]